MEGKQDRPPTRPAVCPKRSSGLRGEAGGVRPSPELKKQSQETREAKALALGAEHGRGQRCAETCGLQTLQTRTAQRVGEAHSEPGGAPLRRVSGTLLGAHTEPGTLFLSQSRWKTS